MLVLDGERRPRGWVAAADLASRAGDSRLSAIPVAAIGHTFRPDADSLRVALDATVLSRTERAVGVDADGRVIGVTSYERLREAIRAAEVAADAEDSAAGDSRGPADQDRTVAGGITT